MPYQSIPYRLVHHSLVNTESHLDLFLLAYATKVLYTYELDLKFIETFIENTKKQDPKIPHSIDKINGEKSWFARAKKEHRLHYWNYSGSISGDRGSIKGIGYGYLCYTSRVANPFSHIKGTLAIRVQKGTQNLVARL